MTFHEPPSIINKHGELVAKKHHDALTKQDLSNTLRNSFSSQSKTFFKEIQSLYKKYHMDLVLQRSSPMLSGTDGEFLPKEFIIKIRPDINNYDLHLAHETAHALEHIYGKMGKIDTHFYGGSSTGMGMFLKSVSPQIREEISKVVSNNFTDKSHQTYSDDLSEQFARFVAEMIVYPEKTERISPNAVKLFKEKFTILRNINHTEISNITIVPQIPAKGYPITDPTYPSSHKKACGHEISKFGISNYLNLEKVVAKTPKDELLGTHDNEGNIYISSRVPPKFIPEVISHEQVEHFLMKLKTWLSDIDIELLTINTLESAKKFRMKIKKQWQNEYNEMFEHLPENLQKELTPAILSIPKKIQSRINQYESD